MSMNKLPVIFLLFLTASMAFTTTPNIVHADSQLLSLVTIIENARGHIKSDIQSADNIPQEVYPTLYETFIFLFQKAGIKNIQIDKNVDFEKLYNQRKNN